MRPNGVEAMPLHAFENNAMNATWIIAMMALELQMKWLHTWIDFETKLQSSSRADFDAQVWVEIKIQM